MISIAMPYYNRKSLFIETLKSISESAYKDIEVVVVDDGSDNSERIEDLVDKYPFLKVIRVEPKDKWYISSCMPWSHAIAKTSGDIILLQNPECVHIHDVLSHMIETIDDSKYIAYSTYSIDKELTEILPELNRKVFFDSLPQKVVTDAKVGWYNHSVYNPCYYCFCAALTRKNMLELGGFDERFAYGTGFEDNDLLNRVRRSGLNTIICDSISVIHQFHPKVWNIKISKHNEYWERNGKLYAEIKGETIVKVKNRYYE